MSMIFEWTVEQMKCFAQQDGREDVVFNVNWRVNASDGSRQATSCGDVHIPYNADALPFTLFADLTESQVIQWVKKVITDEQIERLETMLKADIDSQIAPTIVTPTLPWQHTLNAPPQENLTQLI